MTMNRTPVWMESNDISSLTEIVVLFCETTSDTTMRQIAEDILTEFGVAISRVRGTGYQSAVLAKVLGFNKDSVPLRLSSDEINFLLSLPLPEEMKLRLPKVEE